MHPLYIYILFILAVICVFPYYTMSFFIDIACLDTVFNCTLPIIGFGLGQHYESNYKQTKK